MSFPLVVCLLPLVAHSAPEQPPAHHAAASSATAAAAAVGTTIDCERVWPESASPAHRRSRACARYFLRVQGYDREPTLEALEIDPLVGGEQSWRFTASAYERMAAHVAASCDGPCDLMRQRAIDLFERQGAAQLGIVDPFTLESFEPLLAKVLSGHPLEASDLPLEDDAHWSPMTLWKLRAAVFARHGAMFEHPDLERFFYGDRGPDAMPIDLLPLPDDARSRPVELEEVDRHNLRQLYAYAAATAHTHATKG